MNVPENLLSKVTAGSICAVQLARASKKTLNGQQYVLEQDDSRYTLQIPKEAIAANPNLSN